MGLKLHNILTRSKEEFIPIEKGRLKMYACGITPSAQAHVGHAYQSVVFDVIKKYFEYLGYEVTYVRNYTDVDDKIIDKANQLGKDPTEYANKLIEKTDTELKLLGNDRATFEPRATENIQEIIDFVSELIDKGNAYATESGDVYFRVDSFSHYGCFSNRNLDEAFSGTRKEIEEGKENEKDFALWKKAKPDEISWDSPWGKGRPGWHIECSAMSMKFLDKTIDIHGGGKDLIFPHHENEIAQSESLTGKKFANYWIHNGLVKINGQKMSKSLNNGISIEYLLDNYHKDVLRFMLLKNSYRSDLNIIDGVFEEIEGHIYRFYKIFNAIDNLDVEQIQDDETNEFLEDFKLKFKEAMDNDFNTSVVLSDCFGVFDKLSLKLEKKKVSDLKILKEEIKKIYLVLGVLQDEPKDVLDKIRKKHLEKAGITENEVLDLLEKRKNFKKLRDFKNADKIRDELKGKNIAVKDTKDGYEWDIYFTRE